MSRILVVGEPSRSHGEFRRPWVRALYAAYRRRYGRALATAVARLEPGAEVTVLAGREFVARGTLAGARLRFYDVESLKTEAEPLADLAARLVASWWPSRGDEPLLHAGGVWVPDLLPVAKGILIRLEILEYLQAIERVLDDVKPQRLVLVTGASVAERLARAVAEDRALPTERACRMPAALGVAGLWRALRAREDRLALRRLLTQPRRTPPSGGEPAFLLSACQARHVEMIAPLVTSLGQAGVGAVVLASLIEGDEMDVRLRRLASAGARCAYFTDYVAPAAVRRLTRALRPALRRLRRRVDADPAWEARARHGAVRLAPVLVPLARNAVTWGAPTARVYLEAALRALDALRPAAVVIASDRRYPERALALAARARGIPTLLFWGASLLSRDRINAFDVADRVLLLGEHVRAAMVEQGVEPRRLAVVGDPRSNAARLVPRARLRAEVCADFGLQPGRPLFVLVSKYVSVLFSPGEKEQLYRSMVAALARLERAQVVVKVHPNENLALLREQVRAWGWPDAVLVQDYDIHRLFRAADAAVMVTSMAGVEAMAMECPVVAVQMRGKDFEGGYMPPYVSEGAAARVDMEEPEVLAMTLQRLVTDTAARADLVERGRRFAARYLCPVDGRLAERLLATVAEIRAERAGTSSG